MNDGVREHRYADRATLTSALAHAVAADLRRGIASRGQGLLVVSGGTTPRGFLSALAGEELDWPRVTVTLASTRALYLQIEGADKQDTLAHVRAGDGAYARSPLRALLRTAHVPLDVYSSV